MAKNLILWLVIAVVLMSVFQSFGPSESNGRKVDYSTFLQEVNQDQVQMHKCLEPVMYKEMETEQIKNLGLVLEHNHILLEQIGIQVMNGKEILQE